MADNENSSSYALKPGSNKNIPSSNPSLKATRSNRNYAGVPVKAFNMPSSNPSLKATRSNRNYAAVHPNTVKPANSNQSVLVKNLQPAMCVMSSDLGTNVPTTGRVILRNLATGKKHNKFVHVPPSSSGGRRLKKRSTRRRHLKKRSTRRH